ncbi:Coiled-coil protein [Giardia muris]|uniref:Coiled-coil protein n=1 Tax=Giardia muris TaxID=5742 RepID=A0A4Z1T2K0_GIAMU|nr:Coiled-coil protein [Giardia muris]|eukprot:TNJ26809.1 Coiled-coil protein [Giardia muris]
MLRPLPDDLANAGREETCCSFCGVSYLILHDVERLKGRIRELEGELALAGRAHESAQQSARHTLTSMDALSGLTDAFKGRADLMERERDDALVKERLATERGDLLAQCVAQLRQGLEHCRQDVSRLRSLVAEPAALDFSQIPTFLETLSLLLETLREEYRRVIEKEQRHTEELEAALSALKEEIATLRATSEEKIADLRKRADSFETLTQKLQYQLQETEECVRDLGTTKESLAAENRRLMADVDSLKKQLQAKVMECQNGAAVEDTQRARIVLLTEQLSAKEADLRAVNADLRTSQEEARTLQKTVDDLRQLVIQLQATTAEKDSRIELLISELQGLSRNLEALQHSFDELSTTSEGKIESLEREVHSLRKSLQEEQEHAQTAGTRLNTTEEANSRLAAELTSLKEALINSANTHEQSTRELSREIEALRRENGQLEMQCETLDRRLAKLRQEQNELTTKLATADADLERELALVADLERQLAAKAAEAEALAREPELTTEALAAAQQTIAELEAKVKALQQTVYNECQERTKLLRTLSMLQSQNQGQQGQSTHPSSEDSRLSLPSQGSAGALPTLRKGSFGSGKRR